MLSVEAATRHVLAFMCFRLPITRLSSIRHMAETFKKYYASFCPGFTGGPSISTSLIEAFVSKLTFAVGMRIA